MRSSLLAVAFFSLATLGPIALIACTGGDDDGTSDDGSGSPSEDEIKKKKAGEEGAACNAQKACKTGLLCKQKSTAPPPGALGMPLPSNTSTSSGPPPGALGMPLPPKDGTCQKPAPGEEGGTCSSSQACNAGLDCIYPSSSGSSTSGGPPPGALGMPIPKTGTCKPSSGGSSTSGSGGPPPGALGMPLPPHT